MLPIKVLYKVETRCCVKVKSMEFVAFYFSLGHALSICDSFNHNPGNKVNLNFGPVYSSLLVEI